MQIIIWAEVALALLLWLHALRGLWMTQGLGPELMTSVRLNLEALAWSTVISLGLAYLSVVPVFRPLVADTILLLGRDRAADGQAIPGARRQASYNLIERDVCWRDGVTTTPEFLQLLQELREIFPTL